MPQQTCGMMQATQIRGKSLVFSRVAITVPGRGQPPKLTVELPLDVSFRTNVQIQTGGADPGISAPIAYCVSGGCFGDFALDEETLKKFHGASGIGKLSFADAGGREIAVPLSFKGFAAAFGALSKR